MDTLIGTKYFTYLDLRSGHWQMSEKDKQKTTSSIGHKGFYKCKRIEFGLINSSVMFQSLVERCMDDLNLRECLIFVDDILIFSESFKEHLEEDEVMAM